MNIYEVVYWSSHGKMNSEDTIYLVRASDPQSAVDDVRRNASADDHSGVAFPLPDAVYELGIDLSPPAYSSPRLLRGPYYTTAYNFGWKMWLRNNRESGRVREWDQESNEEDYPRSSTP